MIKSYYITPNWIRGSYASMPRPVYAHTRALVRLVIFSSVLQFLLVGIVPAGLRAPLQPRAEKPAHKFGLRSRLRSREIAERANIRRVVFSFLS